MKFKQNNLVQYADGSRFAELSTEEIELIKSGSLKVEPVRIDSSWIYDLGLRLIRKNQTEIEYSGGLVFDRIKQTYSVNGRTVDFVHELQNIMNLRVK